MKVNDTLVKDFLVVYSCFYREAFFDVKKNKYYERNKNVDQSVLVLMANLPAHD